MTDFILKLRDGSYPDTRVVISGRHLFVCLNYLDPRSVQENMVDLMKVADSPSTGPVIEPHPQIAGQRKYHIRRMGQPWWYHPKAHWMTWMPTTFLGAQSPPWFYVPDIKSIPVAKTGADFCLGDPLCTTVVKDLREARAILSELRKHAKFTNDIPYPPIFDPADILGNWTTADGVKGSFIKVAYFVWGVQGLVGWWICNVGNWDEGLSQDFLAYVDTWELRDYPKRGAFIDFPTQWKMINLPALVRNTVPIAWPYTKALARDERFLRLTPIFLDIVEGLKISLGLDTVRPSNFADGWREQVLAMARYDAFLSEVEIVNRERGAFLPTTDNFACILWEGWNRTTLHGMQEWIPWKTHFHFMTTTTSSGASLHVFNACKPLGHAVKTDVSANTYYSMLTRSVVSTKWNANQRIEMRELLCWRYAPYFTQTFDSLGVEIQPAPIGTSVYLNMSEDFWEDDMAPANLETNYRFPNLLVLGDVVYSEGTPYLDLVESLHHRFDRESSVMVIDQDEELAPASIHEGTGGSSAGGVLDEVPLDLGGSCEEDVQNLAEERSLSGSSGYASPESWDHTSSRSPTPGRRSLSRSPSRGREASLRPRSRPTLSSRLGDRRSLSPLLLSRIREGPSGSAPIDIRDRVSAFKHWGRRHLDTSSTLLPGLGSHFTNAIRDHAYLITSKEGETVLKHAATTGAIHSAKELVLYAFQRGVPIHFGATQEDLIVLSGDRLQPTTIGDRAGWKSVYENHVDTLPSHPGGPRSGHGKVLADLFRANVMSVCSLPHSSSFIHQGGVISFVAQKFGPSDLARDAVRGISMQTSVFRAGANNYETMSGPSLCWDRPDEVMVKKLLGYFSYGDAGDPTKECSLFPLPEWLSDPAYSCDYNTPGFWGVLLHEVLNHIASEVEDDVPKLRNRHDWSRFFRARRKGRDAEYIRWTKARTNEGLILARDVFPNPWIYKRLSEIEREIKNHRNF